MFFSCSFRDSVFGFRNSVSGFRSSVCRTLFHFFSLLKIRLSEFGFRPSVFGLQTSVPSFFRVRFWVLGFGFRL